MLAKGQAATEYLILLAVVLVIAVVITGLLGFYPGLSLDAKFRQSEAYWKAATPLAIDGAVGRDDGFLDIAVRNSGAEPVVLTLINGDNGVYDSCDSNVTYLSPGQAVTLTRRAGLWSRNGICEAQMSFIYDSGSFRSLVQNGSKRLVLYCAKRTSGFGVPQSIPCPLP